MTEPLDDWVSELAADLRLDPDVDLDALLKLARVVAHRVDRRAAPITTFMVGMAAAKAGSPEAMKEAVAAAMRLAEALPEKTDD
jgi:hypothetical protein